MKVEWVSTQNTSKFDNFTHSHLSTVESRVCQAPEQTECEKIQ